MKKKYFPNNWRALKDTPDKHFMSMPYEQFTDWKIHGYDIPDSVYSIIRTMDTQGKVEEFYYSTPRHTHNRIRKSITENKEIYLCTMEGMYHLKPSDLPLDFNNNEHKNIQ